MILINILLFLNDNATPLVHNFWFTITFIAMFVWWACLFIQYEMAIWNVRFWNPDAVVIASVITGYIFVSTAVIKFDDMHSKKK